MALTIRKSYCSWCKVQSYHGNPNDLQQVQFERTFMNCSTELVNLLEKVRMRDSCSPKKVRPGALVDVSLVLHVFL
eukprot:2554534-Amphidinium_carterae.1